MTGSEDRFGETPPEGMEYPVWDDELGWYSGEPHRDASFAGKRRIASYSFDIDEQFVPKDLKPGDYEAIDAWGEGLVKKLKAELEGKLDGLRIFGPTSIPKSWPEDTVERALMRKPTLSVQFEAELTGVSDAICLDDPEVTSYRDDCDQVWEDIIDEIMFPAFARLHGVSEDDALSGWHFSLISRLSLFWVETPGSSEDWFVVSRFEDDACWFMDEYNGFSLEEQGDVDEDGEPVQPECVSYLCWEVPETYVDDRLELLKEQPFLATEEIIEACGGVFLRNELPRVVQMPPAEYQSGDEGDVYTEGPMEFKVRQIHDDTFGSWGMGRPNKTPPRGSMN